MLWKQTEYWSHWWLTGCTSVRDYFQALWFEVDTSFFHFSDKKSGTLVLICELMDMNIYELIRGTYSLCKQPYNIMATLYITVISVYAIYDHIDSSLIKANWNMRHWVFKDQNFNKKSYGMFSFTACASKTFITSNWCTYNVPFQKQDIEKRE